MASLKELGNDRWQVTFFVGLDPITGKQARRWKTFEARGVKAARKIAADIEREIAEQQVTGSRVLFRVCAEKYMAEANIAGSTRYNYQTYLRNIILPQWGDSHIDQITTHLLERWYAELRGAGRAPASIRQAHAVTRNVLKWAMRMGYISSNPAVGASVGASVKPNIRPPRPEDVAKLIAVAPSVEMRTFVFLSAALGTRRAETCGLRWTDIDWERGKVTIERALENVPGRAVAVKTTKTENVRTLSVGPDVLVALGELRTASDKWAAEFGCERRPDGFLFASTPSGSEPWRPDTVTKWFEKLRIAAGVETTLKNLRHFNATQLIANGVDVVTVAGRLGHASSSTTLNFYAKFDDRADKAAAGVLSGLMSKPVS